MKPKSRNLEDVADRLSRVESRRGIMRLATKLAAAVALAGGSLTASWNNAGAYYIKGCNLALAPQSGCSSWCRNAGYAPWVWSVCWNGCTYRCFECYDYPCSAIYSTGLNCGSGGCITPAPPTQ